MRNTSLNEILLLVVFVICMIWVAKADAKTIKLLIIDTGVDLSHEEIRSHVREPMSENYVDDIGHGTGMASLALKDVCEDIELISCKCYSPMDDVYDRSLSRFKNCLREAAIKQVDYINYSSSGEEPNEEEKELIEKLTNKGIVFTISLGNEGKNIFYKNRCIFAFPACYLLNNTYIVGNLGKNGVIYPGSNYGIHKNVRWTTGENVPVLQPNKQYGKLTGTSPATARYMNEILKRKCWELRH